MVPFLYGCLWSPACQAGPTNSDIFNHHDSPHDPTKRTQVETALLRKNAQLERKIEDDKLLIEYLSMMADVELPEALETIGEAAFYDDDSLKKVTIPKKVKKIASMSAFAYCGSLTAVNVAAGNGVYASKNGLVYTKDMKTLLLVEHFVM